MESGSAKGDLPSNFPSNMKMESGSAKKDLPSIFPK